MHVGKLRKWPFFFLGEKIRMVRGKIGEIKIRRKQ